MTEALKFIQPGELKAALDNPQRRNKIVILDVRDDDYAGGHVKGCCNISAHELQSAKVVDQFIQERLSDGVDTVIVHCYLSQQRGPMCASRLAARLAQLERSGQPQVCVLAHGWRRFHQLFGETEWCEYDD